MTPKSINCNKFACIFAVNGNVLNKYRNNKLINNEPLRISTAISVMEFIKRIHGMQLEFFVPEIGADPPYERVNQEERSPSNSGCSRR